MSQPANGTIDRPVWLVGIDGLTWDLLQSWIDAGQLPNFAQLQAASASSILFWEVATISRVL